MIKCASLQALPGKILKKQESFWPKQCIKITFIDKVSEIWKGKFKANLMKNAKEAFWGKNLKR